MLGFLVACSAKDYLDRFDSGKVVHPDPVAWPGGRSASIATPDFRFTFERFNAQIEDFELVTVDAKGQVIHVFPGRRVDPSSGAPRTIWRRRRFSVPGDTVRSLQALLRADAFTELGAAYVDKDAGGEVAYFTLRANGQTKHIQCSKRFPSALARLRAFALEQL